MKDCRDFEALIDRAQTGEASEQEQEALLDHLESCPDCNRFFEAVGTLRNSGLDAEPDADDLLSMRRAVLREIRKGRGKRRSFSLISLLTHPVAAAACAVLLLVFGFLLGRGASKIGRDTREPQTTAATDRFTSAIQKVAQSHTAYEDIVNSPFTYTNVRVTQGQTGMVNLSFDVSRHLDLSLRKEDPLVTEVLVQSLIEPSGVNTRLNAISIADNVPDPKIKKSLIFAMLGDENLAVRMTAQSKLIEHRGDPEITEALLAVLEKEPSVRMRLVAIDYLASSKIQPERLERAVRAGKPENSDAVFLKVSQYLQSLN